MIAVVRSTFRITPNVAPMATMSSALQNSSPRMAGMDNTAAHFLPNRSSNGSINVVYPLFCITEAKNIPPTIKLKPKPTPPCNASGILVNVLSAVAKIYPPSTHVAVMVSVAINKGKDLPATNISAAEPFLTFLDAYQPMSKKMAYMMMVTNTPVQSIFILL